MSARAFSLFLLLGALLALCSVAAACLLGPASLTPADAAEALLDACGLPGGDATDTARLIVGRLRLPRALLAFSCGAALGLAGGVFQRLLDNPLADPFTLGVSAGAAFGACLAIFAGLTRLFPVGGLRFGAVALASLGGGCLSLGAVLFLGRAGGTWRKETLILAGIIVSSFLSALIGLLKALDESGAGSLVFWLMGSFQGRSWSELWLFLPWLAAGAAGTIASVRKMDVFLLGDDSARQLGVRVSRVRPVLLALASLMTGACVAVAGVIGFVGLIVPHLARRLFGPLHGRLLPAAALLGGLLLLWADTASRLIIPGGAELPIGVVTALFGAPFFLFLLLRQRRF